MTKSLIIRPSDRRRYRRLNKTKQTSQQYLVPKFNKLHKVSVVNGTNHYALNRVEIGYRLRSRPEDSGPTLGASESLEGGQTTEGRGLDLSR